MLGTLLLPLFFRKQIIMICGFFFNPFIHHCAGLWVRSGREEYLSKSKPTSFTQHIMSDEQTNMCFCNVSKMDVKMFLRDCSLWCGKQSTDVSHPPVGVYDSQRTTSIFIKSCISRWVKLATLTPPGLVCLLPLPQQLSVSLVLVSVYQCAVWSWKGSMQSQQ